MGYIDIDIALGHLHQNWGFKGLRAKQSEVLHALSEHRQLLALLPTGGGKSLCYQLTALQLDGLSIVISPLIALIEDQVNYLKSIGIKAAAVHSGHSHYDIDRILSNIQYDGTKLLYVSPERLLSESFRVRMQSYAIDLVAVDEAHCIAQWGHDFRPAYKQIHTFVELIKPMYVIGLTGTANLSTIQEICTELSISPKHIIKDSFLRVNILIRIRQSEDKLRDVYRMISADPSKSVIYTRSRRNVEMIASYLQNRGIPSAHYHAGLSFKLKKKIQSQFLKSEIKVVAATNAFGMGIDIPDITTVIHYDIPPSIEEYYQEIGRAGRNGQQSQAVLFYSDSDLNFQSKRLEMEFPPIEQLYHLYRKTHQYFGHELNQGMERRYALDIDDLSIYASVGAGLINRQLEALAKLGCLSVIHNPRDQWHLKYALDFRSVREFNVATEHRPLKEALMRSYAFQKDDWFALDIERLAKDLKSDQSAIEASIKSLSKTGLIRWHHLPAGPTIVFTEGRLIKKDFYYKSNKYDKLKKIKTQRLQSMLDLIKSDICYNKKLLGYFNEVLTPPCKLCENCLNTGLQQISAQELTAMKSEELQKVIAKAIDNKNVKLLRSIQHLAAEQVISSTMLSDITDEIF